MTVKKEEDPLLVPSHSPEIKEDQLLQILPLYLPAIYRLNKPNYLPTHLFYVVSLNGR